jgi:hypothetical protein
VQGLPLTGWWFDVIWKRAFASRLASTEKQNQKIAAFGSSYNDER